MVPVITVTGSSDSGKTTFVERIVPRLRGEGLRVGTVKHAPHGFDADRSGSDSHRHATGGADPVALVGPDGHALFCREAVDVDEVVTRHLGHVDLVLVEGLASRRGPTILTHRAGVPPRQRPVAADLLFVVTDEALTDPPWGDGDPPHVAPDDLEGAVALILAHLASVRPGDDPLPEGNVVELVADGVPLDLDAGTAGAVAAELVAALPPGLSATTHELILRLKLR
jgi:molybdopterin-guanine dinucleotide biosynthesis protein MobB